MNKCVQILVLKNHNAKIFKKNKYFYKGKYKNLYLINILFRINNCITSKGSWFLYKREYL